MTAIIRLAVAAVWALAMAWVVNAAFVAATIPVGVAPW